MANWQFDVVVVVVAVLRSLPSDVIALSLLFFRGLFQGCCQVPTSSSALHLIQQCGEMIVLGHLCLPRSRTTFCMSARGCYRGRATETDRSGADIPVPPTYESELETTAKLPISNQQSVVFSSRRSLIHPSFVNLSLRFSSDRLKSLKGRFPSDSQNAASVFLSAIGGINIVFP